MREEILNYLCCPITHGDLELLETVRNSKGKIISGKLVSENGFEYLIQDGIVNLIPNMQIEDKKRNEDVYEKISESYVSVLHNIGKTPYDISQMDSLRFSIFSITQSLCNRFLKGNVLEIGAGGDYLRSEFATKCDNWVSLDYDLRSNSIDLRGDGQQLPLKSAVFDTIVSVDVLEHVPNPDKFISEIFRTLKPGGVVILSTPFFFYLHEEPNDYFRFSKYGLRTIFERNGLTTLDVIPTGGVIGILGLLISIFITKKLGFSSVILRLLLSVHRFVQMRLFVPMDRYFDKNKRFAQGHFIVAKK